MVQLRNSVLVLCGVLAGPALARTAAAETAPAPATTPEAVAVAPTPPPAPIAPFKIETSDGSSMKLGILLQPQYSAVSSSTLDGMNHNIYLRRTRILLGGTLFGRIDYFIDTDYPNLFLDNVNTAPAGMPATNAKATPGLNIQDAFATYKALGDTLKVDVGYMLPPLAHNAVQGAGTLYGWDYFAYSFQQGNSFGSSASPVGRDVGVQLRGLVLGGLLEYRAGLFQGLRQAATPTESPGRNFFRTTARVQVNLFDPETGFFYAGSYLGTKKVLSFGASLDFQDHYYYVAGDVFADLPVGPGLLTGQLNVIHLDGGETLVALPKQTAEMGEVGYGLPGLDLSPIVRFEHIGFSGASANGTASSDSSRYGIGAAYWARGHTVNLKLFYTRIAEDGAARGTNQINLQAQLYVF